MAEEKPKPEETWGEALVQKLEKFLNEGWPGKVVCGEPYAKAKQELIEEIDDFLNFAIETDNF